MPRAVRFGSFELHPDEHRLWCDGVPVRLGARALDLLCVLAGRPGELVTKDELLDRVWPGLVVEEANVQVQVSLLRKAIGHEVVATVPGLGYRFTPGAPAAPEPAAAVAAPPPVPLAPLVGRAAELAALQAAVQAQRLVTLVGPGGVGKTRLAQALAADCGDALPVGWVDLARIAAGQALAPALAQGLGAGLEAGDDAEAIARALRSRAQLLVVDNCEHLLDALAPLLAQLLAGAPGLRVLATSRAALQLSGESVLRLAPLAVPQPNDAPDAARARPALALLLQRAAAADRHWVLPDAQLPQAAALCRRLDGLPLALEMAAARLPALGVALLLEQLQAQPGALRNLARDAPPRQRSLQEMLDWSHSLLTPEQAAVLRRLSVFAGSFGLDAAQATAADAALDRWAVVDALAALVDLSLVKLERSAPPRYRLLETTRADARRRLAAAGEEAAVQRRHVQAMVALAAGLCAPGAAARDDAWDEHADLAQAFDAACASGDGEAAAGLLDGLRRVEQRVGLRAAAQQARCEAVLPLLPACSPRAQAVVCRVVASYGWIDLPALPRVEAARRAVALMPADAPATERHHALVLLGVESARVDDFAAADAALDRAAAMEAQGGLPATTRANRLLGRAMVATWRQDLPACRDALAEALATCGDAAAWPAAPQARAWLAWARLETGDDAGAIAEARHLWDDAAGPGAASLFRTFAGVTLARAQLLAGRSDDCGTLLQTLLRAPEAQALLAGWESSLLEVAGAWACLRGWHEAGARWLAGATQVPAGDGVRDAASSARLQALAGAAVDGAAVRPGTLRELQDWLAGLAPVPA